MAKYECLKCGNKFKSISNFTHHLTQEESDDLKQYIQKLRRQLAELSADYHDLAETTETIFKRAKEVKQQRDLFYTALNSHRKQGIYIDDDFKIGDREPMIYRIPKTGAEYFIFSRKAMARLAIKDHTGQNKIIEGIKDKLTTKEKELKKLQRAKSGKEGDLEKLKKLYSSALATIKNNEATIKDLKAKVQKRTKTQPRTARRTLQTTQTTQTTTRRRTARPTTQQTIRKPRRALPRTRRRTARPTIQPIIRKPRRALLRTTDRTKKYYMTLKY